MSARLTTADHRLLGLDLSLTATGMSDGATTWVLPTSGRRDDTLTLRGRRLSGLRGAVGIACADIDLVVIEGPSFGQGRQSGTHDRAGLWWLVVADLLDRAVPVVEIPPAVLKKYATGKGNASKGQMIDATARRFPAVETDADDNRCDALWLAAIGLDRLTGACVVPAAHRIALLKVAWPSDLAEVRDVLGRQETGR